MKTQGSAEPALKKLTLNRETLRRLTTPELQFVVGGRRPDASVPTYCP
jgi:hypothetical protein